MHHDRLLARPILGDIFKIKPLRQVEIELHGRKLPQPPDRIHQLDIDLRTVKCRLARNYLVLDIQFLQNFFKRARRLIPLLFTADEVLAVIRIPGRKLGLELVEAKIPQHVARELHAIGDLFFNLFGVQKICASSCVNPRTRNKPCITPDRSYRYTVPSSPKPHRQIAVRPQRIFINQNVPRAIHRLQPILGVIQFHRVEHVLRVIALVAGGLPQLLAHHVRRVNQRIPALHVLLAHPVFHLFANDPALRMPEDQPRPSQFLNRKQIQLLAEHAVIALLRLFNRVQVGVEVLLRKKRSPINPLELRILLVPQPVRARQYSAA